MSSEAIWNLTWGLVSVLALYVLASGTRRSVAIGAILILIPFQIVDTRYASSSVLMAYALAVILLLNGGLKVRMLPALGLIVLAYLISLTLADRELISFHLAFAFQFFSCLVVFLLAYNFARLVKSERSVIDVLLATNALVAVYCLLQVTAGPGEAFVPFGVEELRFNENRRAGDARLTGPFNNAGTTAGYFMLMTLVTAVELIFARGRRRWLVLFLIAMNLLFLLATANRGAFLVLLALFPVVLILFRRELGARRVLQYLVGGAAVLALASTVAIYYTEFGLMYERMEQVTETQDGIPSTRARTWPIAVEKIRQAPWFGEGPYFANYETAEAMGWVRGTMDPWPHSLYLYLLRTVGAVGLVTVIGFFLHSCLVLGHALQRERGREYRSAIVRLGLVLIVAFLVEQIRLEFNRPSTMDYAQFIFALVGLFIGVSDRGSSDLDVDQPGRLAESFQSGRLAGGRSAAG